MQWVQGTTIIAFVNPIHVLGLSCFWYYLNTLFLFFLPSSWLHLKSRHHPTSSLANARGSINTCYSSSEIPTGKDATVVPETADDQQISLPANVNQISPKPWKSVEPVKLTLCFATHFQLTSTTCSFPELNTCSSTSWSNRMQLSWKGIEIPALLLWRGAHNQIMSAHTLKTNKRQLCLNGSRTPWFALYFAQSQCVY